MLTPWLEYWSKAWSGGRAGARGPARTPRLARPTVEALEAREVPSTTVLGRAAVLHERNPNPGAALARTSAAASKDARTVVPEDARRAIEAVPSAREAIKRKHGRKSGQGRGVHLHHRRGRPGHGTIPATPSPPGAPAGNNPIGIAAPPVVSTGGSATDGSPSGPPSPPAGGTAFAVNGTSFDLAGGNLLRYGNGGWETVAIDVTSYAVLDNTLMVLESSGNLYGATDPSGPFRYWASTVTTLTRFQNSLVILESNGHLYGMTDPRVGFQDWATGVASWTVYVNALVILGSNGDLSGMRSPSSGFQLWASGVHDYVVGVNAMLLFGVVTVQSTAAPLAIDANGEIYALGVLGGPGVLSGTGADGRLHQLSAETFREFAVDPSGTVYALGDGTLQDLNSYSPPTGAWTWLGNGVVSFYLNANGRLVTAQHR
jgi:hypothetical protein